MASMQTFLLWFLQELPAFLMAEPICFFVAFGFLFVTVRLIRSIINLT